MPDFIKYYNSTFKEDINIFFSTIPDDSRFHEDKENKRVFSIQYERLTPSKTHLDFLGIERKESFGVALFFTILIDMVCYTHYQSYYHKFQSLTRYPKLIGNCLSWCHYHLHPREIFYAMNKNRIVNERHLVFIDKFSEAVNPIKLETIHFFNNYMSEVNVAEFWEKCEREFPY